MLHSRRLFLLLAFCLTVLSLSQIAAQDETPTLTPVPTETLIPTLPPTETATDLPSETPLPTETPTEVPSFTPTPLPSETPTLFPTPTVVETVTETATETVTEAPTVLAADSPTPTTTATTPTATISTDDTLTVMPTLTETITGTATAVETPTSTATATQSILPPEPPLASTLFDGFDTPFPVNWSANPDWSIVADNGGQVLQTHTGSPLTFASPMLPFLNEVAVEFRVRFSAGTFKMNLRQSEAGDYAAELNANGQVNVYRLGQLINTATVTPNSEGQWRTFRLSAVDHVVRVSIDGAEVTGFIDASPLPHGGLTISATGLAADGLTVDDMGLWWYDRSQQPNQNNTVMANRVGVNAVISPLAFTVPNLEAITYVNTISGSPTSGQLYSVYGSNTVTHLAPQGAPSITNIGQPVWSPTLPLLAYSCLVTIPGNISPGSAICIAKVDSNLQQVAMGYINGGSNPRWSPDGTRLAWEAQYYTHDGYGYGISASQIYLAYVGLQNDTILITSPNTPLFGKSCIPQTWYINQNTLEWGGDGYVYFGMNSGPAAIYSEGFYRISVPNPVTTSCQTENKVVGIADIAGFNNTYNAQLTLDTHSLVRVKQNGDMLFGDQGSNIMLYRPAAPTNAIFKRAADNGRGYSWSPDGTQVAFIRRPISGVNPPDTLNVKADPYDNDSSNVDEILSSTAPNQDRGLVWNVPHSQEQPVSFCLSRPVTNDPLGLNIRPISTFNSTAVNVHGGILKITGVYSTSAGRWLRVDPYINAGNPGDGIQGWVWEDVFLNPCADGSSVNALPIMDDLGNIVALPTPVPTTTPPAPPSTPQYPNPSCQGVHTANPSRLRTEPYTDSVELQFIEGYQAVNIHSRFDFGSNILGSTVWYQVGFVRGTGEQVYGWMHQSVLDQNELNQLCQFVPSDSLATRTPSPTLTPTPSSTPPPDLSGIFPLPMIGLGGEPARLTNLGCQLEYSYSIPSRDVNPRGRNDAGHLLLTSATSTIMVVDRDAGGNPGVFVSFRIAIADLPLAIRQRLATLNAIPDNTQFSNIPVDATGSLHIAYSHLSTGSIPVTLEPAKLNDGIQTTEVIPSTTTVGLSGDTGHTFGPHLDVAVFYIPDSGRYPLDAIHFESYGDQTYFNDFRHKWDAFWTMYDEAIRKPDLYGTPIVVNPLVLWPSLQEGTGCSFY